MRTYSEFITKLIMKVAEGVYSLQIRPLLYVTVIKSGLGLGFTYQSDSGRNLAMAS